MKRPLLQWAIHNQIPQEHRYGRALSQKVEVAGLSNTPQRDVQGSRLCDFRAFERGLRSDEPRILKADEAGNAERTDYFSLRCVSIHICFPKVLRTVRSRRGSRRYDTRASSTALQSYRLPHGQQEGPTTARQQRSADGPAQPDVSKLDYVTVTRDCLKLKSSWQH